MQITEDQRIYLEGIMLALVERFPGTITIWERDTRKKWQSCPPRDPRHEQELAPGAFRMGYTAFYPFQ